MDSFSDTFAVARSKFLAACLEAGARLKTYTLEGARGETGEPLATDVACLGPDIAPRAAIVISGTHGAEGFCGSAIQTHWLSHSRYDLNAVKLVLVHAINPWAFSIARVQMKTMSTSIATSSPTIPDMSARIQLTTPLPI